MTHQPEAVLHEVLPVYDNKTMECTSPLWFEMFAKAFPFNKMKPWLHDRHFETVKIIFFNENHYYFDSNVTEICSF